MVIATATDTIGMNVLIAKTATGGIHDGAA